MSWPCWALNRALLPQIEFLQIDLTKQRIELLLPWIHLNEPRIFKLLFPGIDLTESRIELSQRWASLSSLESSSSSRSRKASASRLRVYFVLAVFLLLMHGYSKALHHLWDNFSKKHLRKELQPEISIHLAILWSDNTCSSNLNNGLIWILGNDNSKSSSLPAHKLKSIGKSTEQPCQKAQCLPFQSLRYAPIVDFGTPTNGRYKN